MALRIVADGWCLERDRRWPDYASQAAAWPWPRSYVFTEASPGLMLAMAGGGGGSQQATFRGELERYVTAAWARCPTSGAPAERLACLEHEVQRSFVTATSPTFAEHFTATWVAALTDGVRCAVRSHFTERAWLWRAGQLEQVSRDGTVLDALPGGSTGDAARDGLLKGLCEAQFGAWLPSCASQAASFEWRPDDVLLLATALPVPPARALAAASGARELFEALCRDVEELDPEHVQQSMSKAAVILARACAG